MPLVEFTRVPDLRSPFLSDVAAALLRRRRALDHRGRFLLAHDPDDAFEWISAEYEPPGPWPAVRMQVAEHRRITLRVLSPRRADRGRVLFRFDDRPVPGRDQAAALAGRFEATIDAVAGRDGARPDRVDLVRDIWRDVVSAEPAKTADEQEVSDAGEGHREDQDEDRDRRM